MEFQLHMARFRFKNAISESSVTGKKSGFITSCYNANIQKQQASSNS
jgi:hypothetical protein